MTDRLVICRYLRRDANRCTAEVTDAQGEILLCVEHLARALELVRARIQ